MLPTNIILIIWDGQPLQRAGPRVYTKYDIPLNQNVRSFIELVKIMYSFNLLKTYGSISAMSLLSCGVQLTFV